MGDCEDRGLCRLQSTPSTLDVLRTVSKGDPWTETGTLWLIRALQPTLPEIHISVPLPDLAPGGPGWQRGWVEASL